jgi:diaminopimelate epimerase
MSLTFTKMHGLGNDFMVINGVHQKIHLTKEQIQSWGNRRTGIGFDQLLLVEAAKNSDTDFFYRIFNADGSESGQCGNGARCIAKFLRDENLSDKNSFRLETISSILELTKEKSDLFTVNMSEPIFDPQKIPFISETESLTYSISISPKKQISISALSVGNPHCVLFIDNIQEAPVSTLGEQLSLHPQFPEKTNVEFCRIIDENHIELRVYERGVGETLACGSGACAAVIAGRLLKSLNAKVNVKLPGGELMVRWEGKGAPVFLTGPAENVFKGVIK